MSIGEGVIKVSFESVEPIEEKSKEREWGVGIGFHSPGLACGSKVEGLRTADCGVCLGGLKALGRVILSR